MPTLSLQLPSADRGAVTSRRSSVKRNTNRKVTLTLGELLAQYDALQQQLERGKSEEAQRVLREIVRKMRDYGTTAERTDGQQASGGQDR